MAGSLLKRLFLRHETTGVAPTVPCPGCGGRGRFEWSRDDKLPRQWSWDAPCGMCEGRGLIPSSWPRDEPTARVV
jgi:DnaJ-class molecular chaperone